MTTKILFGISLIFCAARILTAQCITANDIVDNETDIKSAVRDISEGSIQFSLNLLRTLNREKKADKNLSGIFFSPHSIWSALIVTYMGARGATEMELRNVLNLGHLDKMATWRALGKLQDSKNNPPSRWNRNPNRPSYHSANRIYFQEGTVLKDCIQEMLGNNIAFEDFASDAEKSRENINSWIEKETQQKIKDLIPPNGINRLTRMVIANAVYFKEDWVNKFPVEKTARRRFTTPSRKDIFVSMMKTTGTFLHAKSEDLNCVAVELPYADGRMSMLILLPNNRYSGVDNLANILTPMRLENLLWVMEEREVTVSIPKFKMEDQFELSSVLDNMGLRTLFEPTRVDLSGFTGQNDLSVDAVHHKSFIDVNEEGTEAAAATYVISSRMARRKQIAFTADYPFIYFIRDRQSDRILFIGTMQQPPEYKSA